MDIYKPGQNFVYWSEKLDGNQLVIQTNSRGETVYQTRNGHLLNLDFLALPKVEREQKYFGELYYPGEPASYVRTAIKQKDYRLELRIWMVAHLDDWKDLDYCWFYCHNRGFKFVQYGDFFPAITSAPLRKDCDGYVFRDANNVRLTKYKPEKTIDLVVCGVTRGEGKYRKQIGALICRTSEGIVVAQCSGMDDATRLEFTANPPIDKVVELAYNAIGSKGKLIWPRFKRVRDDKDITQCLLSQDAKLQEYWNARS